MDDILRQLGELALGAVPTIVIFLVLWTFYRVLVHKPLARVLSERESRTTGAIRRSQVAIAAAEQKGAEYEKRIREARISVYKAQESRRGQVLEARNQAIAEARLAARAMVQSARAELEKEASEAKAMLQVEVPGLAREIIRTILGERVQERTPVMGGTR